MAATKHITLSELQVLIKKGIAERHPMPYWVVAEISEIKVNYSGHYYLELVEKGGENSIPKAKANAVIWRNHYTMIGSYFQTATGGDLCAGLKVLVKVAVHYHELYGLSFQITDIEPSYTLGDIEAQRRETILRLQQEGIYEMNRQTDLPKVLQRLAVVSSAQAAGYQDFMNELNKNAPGYTFRVTLFQSLMQGHQTEDSVIQALDRIAERLEDFDAVILIRGGGSQSDLSAFNSYRLCSHLAQFLLPVLTGIGHDKDQSVADLVAHTALKTPTAVAAFLIEHHLLFEAGIDQMLRQLSEFARDNLQHEQNRLREYAHRLNQRSAGTIHESGRRLDRLLPDIGYCSMLRIREQSLYCRSLSGEMARVPRQKIAGQADRLTTASARVRELSRNLIQHQANRLELLDTKLEGKNPERILQMGYAIVRRENGQPVTHIREIHTGDTLTLQLSGGTARTQIIDTHQKTEEP
ncbi:MAG: exodeoxyribonuclease VII large subunit [Rikenellaceae bacterium]|nr:exodeoxyribonuclease VII large subunit [Rikenellaceae bacterium]